MFIINIICIVNSEKKIKDYIKSIYRNIWNNNEEDNKQDNKEIICNYDNISQYIFSFSEKVFIYFLDYYKVYFDIYATFFNNDNNYEEFKIVPIKIMIYIDSILLTILLDTLFMNDEAMHKFYEENGNIILFIDCLSYFFQIQYLGYFVIY